MARLQCNKFRGDKGKIILVLRVREILLAQGEILQVDRQDLLNATTTKVKDIWLGNALSLSDQGMQYDPRILAGQAQTIIPHNAAFQTEDLDTYDSDCDDLLIAQTVLMANISNYGSDVISESLVARDLGSTRCFSVASMKEKRMVFEMVFELRRLSQQGNLQQKEYKVTAVNTTGLGFDS
ncbi:hypothetical protein Tco_0904997 [Tanacetum coccineum]